FTREVDDASDLVDFRSREPLGQRRPALCLDARHQEPGPSRGETVADLEELGRRLPRPVDDLGEALPRCAVVVEAGERLVPDRLEWRPAQALERGDGARLSRGDLLEETEDLLAFHAATAARSRYASRIAFASSRRRTWKSCWR